MKNCSLKCFYIWFHYISLWKIFFGQICSSRMLIFIHSINQFENRHVFESSKQKSNQNTKVCTLVNEQKKYCPEIKEESHGMRMLDLVGHLLLQTRKLKTRKMKWFTQVTRLSSWLNHKENTCLMKAVYPTIPLIFYHSLCIWVTCGTLKNTDIWASAPKILI